MAILIHWRKVRTKCAQWLGLLLTESTSTTEEAASVLLRLLLLWWWLRLLAKGTEASGRLLLWLPESAESASSGCRLSTSVLT